jgi:hypothetical protein
MSTMKKRIPMFLLALAMMVAMALPTFADGFTNQSSVCAEMLTDFAELRKVWGGRVFPALLAILAAANLLLLWMGTRPTAKQPPASAYRAVGAELSDKTMEEKRAYLHDKYTEIESLVKIGQYYREQAYGGYGLTQYRQDNAAMFDTYEQEYNDKSYTLKDYSDCAISFLSHAQQLPPLLP